MWIALGKLTVTTMDCRMRAYVGGTWFTRQKKQSVVDHHSYHKQQ